MQYSSRQPSPDMPPQMPRRRRWLRRIVISLGLLVVLGLLAAGGVAAIIYHKLTADLPDVAELEQYQPSLVTKVYDRNGELIADFFIERRFLVPLEQIPISLQQATVAVEDARFYTHSGIDLIGVLRAMWVNFRAGEVREGASTITQQVARTLFLTRERTLRRKIREIILARRIEQRFSKDRILEMYLNQIYYGHDAYGVEAAAQLYFGKSVQDLTVGEAALIAGLPSAPNTYSPLRDLSRSLQRRQHVLRRMVDVGYLTPEEALRAHQEPVRLASIQQKQVNKAPYFVEYVRQYMVERYGAKRLYHGGFHVYTTLDLGLQRAAVQALRRGLMVVDKRHGYQGPRQHITLTGNAATDQEAIRAVTMADTEDPTLRGGEVLPGVVLEVRGSDVVVAVKTSRGILPRQGYTWVREADLERDFARRRVLAPEEIFTPGDVVQVRIEQVDSNRKPPQLSLEQEPAVQGALLALEPGSGHILAMVGGYDFATSQFNRAVQAVRQPGSAFKPIIYTAALEAGMTPASIIIDAPFVKKGPGNDDYWKPENYSHRFYGPTTLRTALAKSRNLVTIRILDKIGIPRVLGLARRLGIRSRLAPYLSLALGASGVTLAELTAAYSVFTTGGLYVKPEFITKIVDAQGTVLEEHFPAAQRVLTPEVAYVMTNLLQGVVQNGTGRRARALGRPVAGKTGTTNDFRDAWFMGYTPGVIAGVWVGIDDRTVLGHRETGGRVAAPIWLEFMQAAMRGRPITDFPIPPGVRFVRIDAAHGTLATASTQGKTLFEAFVDGTQPTTASQPVRNVRQRIRRLDRLQPSALDTSSEREPLRTLATPRHDG
jgi:penicillin-binding protein 1A